MNSKYWRTATPEQKERKRARERADYARNPAQKIRKSIAHQKSRGGKITTDRLQKCICRELGPPLAGRLAQMDSASAIVELADVRNRILISAFGRTLIFPAR